VKRAYDSPTGRPLIDGRDDPPASQTTSSRPSWRSPRRGHGNGQVVWKRSYSSSVSGRRSPERSPWTAPKVPDW